MRRASLSSFQHHDASNIQRDYTKDISNPDKREHRSPLDIIRGLPNQQTKQILNGAYQELQQQSDKLKERMKGTPDKIAKNLSYQQRQYELARIFLEPFLNGKEQFLADRLDDIKRSAEIKNDAGGSKANGYMLDALSKAIEKKKQELAYWKQTVYDLNCDKFRQAVEILQQAHKRGEIWYQQGQEGTLKFPKEKYNKFVKLHNKSRREIFLDNTNIFDYNAFFPENTPIKELELPEKLKCLHTEANSKSWLPSWLTSYLPSLTTFMRGTGTALTTWAWTREFGLTYAQQTNNALEVNGHGFSQGHKYLDHPVPLPEDQRKDAFGEGIIKTPSLDTSFTSKDLGRRDIPDIPLEDAQLVAQTDLVNVYVFGNNSKGSDYQKIAQAVANAVGPDNTYLADTFGLTPDGLPYNVYLNLTTYPGRASTIFGAGHTNSCDNTTFFVTTDDRYSPSSVAAEMVEVYEAAINNGWDCAHTNGESLSRTIASVLHPPFAFNNIVDESVNWWKNGAIDYISSNNAIDRNQDASGCGALFLNYLHDGLEVKKPPSWSDIVKAGGNTLAETYSKLTGKDPGTAFQNFKEALQPFVNGTQLLVPVDGNPWAAAKRKRQQEEAAQKAHKWKTIEIAAWTIGASTVLAVLIGAYYKHRQRQRRNASQQQETELDTVA